MTDTVSIIRERLTQALSPDHLTILDESEAHRGHAGAQNGAGHYFVSMSSSQFDIDNPVYNHQLVYQALGDLIPSVIHALRIETIIAPIPCQ